LTRVTPHDFVLGSSDQIEFSGQQMRAVVDAIEVPAQSL
jgi:hypothetical protein